MNILIAVTSCWLFFAVIHHNQVPLVNICIPRTNKQKCVWACVRAWVHVCLMAQCLIALYFTLSCNQSIILKRSTISSPLVPSALDISTTCTVMRQSSGQGEKHSGPPLIRAFIGHDQASRFGVSPLHHKVFILKYLKNTHFTLCQSGWVNGWVHTPVSLAVQSVTWEG